MRRLVIAFAALTVAALAWLQLAADIAVRQRAAPGSWVAWLPPAAAARFEAVAARGPVSPALALLLARRALEDGDMAVAAARIAGLPVSPERASLEGQLAEARGDEPAAVRAYLLAGDLDGLERAIARVESSGRIGAALALQQAVVTRLRADRTQSDALARAYLDLGRLEETQAYQFAPGDARRYRHELESSAAYVQAVALDPYDERTLVAAGNQTLNVGDPARAERYFARAERVDPRSVAALVGLGEAALGRGDRERATQYYMRARELAPRSPEAARLGRKLAPR